MRKWIWLALPLLLTGCRAEPQWEYVTDEPIEVVQVLQEPYKLTYAVPEDAVLGVFSSDETGKVYFQRDGDYEITSRTLQADSAESVIRQVSGFDAGELVVLELSRGTVPEYRFAWSSQTEYGSVVSQASVLEDGGYYYALVFSVKEDCKLDYEDCAKAVFASLGLHADEQF